MSVTLMFVKRVQWKDSESPKNGEWPGVRVLRWTDVTVDGAQQHGYSSLNKHVLAHVYKSFSYLEQPENNAR